MNKVRRKEITTNLNELIIIKENFERILSDEEDTYDNIPENLQSSYRAMESEDAIDSLDESISYLTEAIDNIEDAINSIEEI